MHKSVKYSTGSDGKARMDKFSRTKDTQKHGAKKFRNGKSSNGYKK